MKPGQTSSLQLPSFLHGTFRLVQQKAKREGLRCGEQYQKDGAFLLPRQMMDVPLGEVVVARDVVDFLRERPAWRLYMVSDVMSGLRESLDWQNTQSMRSAYEAFFRETAWGAVFFATTYLHPMSAERMAQRLQALLRFWEPLQCARYLFKTPGEAHTLEELMVASCDWAMDAWCPGEDAPVRARLSLATERMARATREDCIEAIFREMPRALAHVGKLKHRDVVTDPVFQRERLTTLDPRAFERVSGALTGELISLLLDWDHELGLQ